MFLTLIEKENSLKEEDKKSTKPNDKSKDTNLNDKSKETNLNDNDKSKDKDKKCIYPGDTAIIEVRFMYKPEIIEPNQIFFMREGLTLGIGSFI